VPTVAPRRPYVGQRVYFKEPGNYNPEKKSQLLIDGDIGVVEEVLELGQDRYTVAVGQTRVRPKANPHWRGNYGEVFFPLQKFKVGDRVKFIDDRSGCPKGLFGATGTVIKVLALSGNENVEWLVDEPWPRNSPSKGYDWNSPARQLELLEDEDQESVDMKALLADL
jgi:hypothetical protein